MSDRKRKDASVEEKKKLILEYDKLPKMPQREAAAILGISQSTLNTWLKKRDSFMTSEMSSTAPRGQKRKREGKNPLVGEALLVWFKQAVANNAPINRQILMLKANKLAEELGENFKASDGWLTRWMARREIVFRKLHGEKQDADTTGANQWIETVLPSILSRYSPDDIYNLDETGLYYRATPDYCMIFKNAPNSAGKKIKARITVVLACNMTGTVKLKPLIIGNSRNPRCFKGVKNLPVDYRNNSSAWQTSTIFENQLRILDSELDHQIAILVDNCPAHPKLTFKNIELIFLPPNTTSLIQPLDQGIIRSFKALYRSDMRMTIIDAIDEGQGSSAEIAKRISLLDAIHMADRAWAKVSSACIINCFKKAGFISNVHEGDVPENPILDIPNDLVISQEFNDWVDIDADLPTTQIMEDHDIALTILESQRSQNDLREEDSDDEKERKCVTRRDTLNALRVLRQATEENDIDKKYFSILNELESVFTLALPPVQSTITSFFEKI